MDTLSYKTISANEKTANKEWFVVDAKDQILGRLASKVAKILRGKLKTNYTPHADCGDNVIIINAGHVIMTGDKMSKRQLFSHTGFPGGQKRITPEQMLQKDETSLVRHAIKGMLPKNRLGRKILKNCFIYKSDSHNQEAQKPKVLNLNEIK
jgi:large subunit ribosomal protein L13